MSSVGKAAPWGWQGMDSGGWGSGFVSWNEAGQLARLNSAWLHPSSWPWPKFRGTVLRILQGELLQGCAWALERLDLPEDFPSVTRKCRQMPLAMGWLRGGGCRCVKGSEPFWELRKAHQAVLWGQKSAGGLYHTATSWPRAGIPGCNSLITFPEDNGPRHKKWILSSSKTRKLPPYSALGMIPGPHRLLKPAQVVMTWESPNMPGPF